MKAKKVKKTLKKSDTSVKPDDSSKAKAAAKATPKTAAKATAKSKGGAKEKPKKAQTGKSKTDDGVDDGESTPAVVASQPKRQSVTETGGVQEKEPKKPRKAKSKTTAPPAPKTAPAEEGDGNDGMVPVPVTAVAATRTRKPPVSQEPMEPVTKLHAKKVDVDKATDGETPPEKKAPLPRLPAESPCLSAVPTAPDESQSQSQQTTWYLGCKHKFFRI